MTVIATLISRNCIVHASDSLVTVRRRDGTACPLDWKATKLVPVRACRGMLAYYGFAGLGGGWTTLDWLRNMGKKSPPSAEEFAKSLAAQLEAELRKLRVHRRPGFGLGIHFAAYERVSGYWVPELFHISNWKDTSYTAIRPEGVGWSRDSFVTMFPQKARKTPMSERLALREALLEGRFLQFNNGDPALFNPVADAFLDMIGQAGKRGVRPTMDPQRWRALARRPVEAVADMARDFVKPEYRIVGGRIRDLILTPDGRYFSSSGDAG